MVLLTIMCFCSLQHRLVRETCLAGPESITFLKTAVTFAERQSMGTSSLANDLWNTSVKNGANSSAKSFRMHAGIIAGPDALLG